MSGPLPATMSAKLLIAWRISLCALGAEITSKPAAVSMSAMAWASFAGLGNAVTVS